MQGHRMLTQCWASSRWIQPSAHQRCFLHSDCLAGGKLPGLSMDPLMWRAVLPGGLVRLWPHFTAGETEVCFACGFHLGLSKAGQAGPAGRHSGRFWARTLILGFKMFAFQEFSFYGHRESV